MLSGCDHTELVGTIVVDEMKLNVGEPVLIMLEVPDDMEEIHGVLWATYYKDNGQDMRGTDQFIYVDELEQLYTDEQLLNLFGITELKEDRMVVLIPTHSGEHTIEVYGFLYQTNPQPITNLEVIVK